MRISFVLLKVALAGVLLAAFTGCETTDGGGSVSGGAYYGVGAYSDTGLAAGSTYAYRSRAANSAGFSDYSNTSSATTAAPSAPGTPGNPSPADGGGNVNWGTNLTWSAASASTFDVYFGTSSNPPLFAGNVTTPSFALSRLAQGTTFYWRIVAKNAMGNVDGPVWSFKTKMRGKK